MGTFPLSVKRRGNNILIRWCDEEGVRGRQKVKFSPTLYMKNPNSSPSGITNVFNENLDPIPFETMRDANEFIDRYKNTPGAGVYGINNYITQFMTQVYPNGYRIDPHLVRGAYLDIEVFSGSLDSTGNVVAGPFPDAENAKFPINAITVYASHHKKFFTWAINPKYLFEMKDNPQFKYDDQYGLHLESSDIDYREFKNESELLRNFLSWWSAQEFDFWTGWNIESFDCPYIVHRAQKVLSDSWANMLSPWDILNKRTVKSAWKEYTTYDFVGCEMLDMLDVYKKHTFKTQTSYKLDHIAFVECGEKKIDYKEARNLNKLYLMDYNKFIHYNINDVRLTKLIDEKVGLMNITMVLAEIARINFADTLGSIKPWSSILDTAFWKRGQVMEVKQIKQARDFKGGYVKDPVRGRHKWVVSEDLNSEYPHVRQQYNIGPETFVTDYKFKRQIIDGLCNDIRKAINETSNLGHRRLLNKLMVAIDTESSDINDELIACDGLIHFEALRKFNVTMTPNVNFFKKDRMSIYNELDRKFYDTRSKEKKLMKAFEQDLVLIKEELHYREQNKKSSNFVDQTEEDLISKMPSLVKKIARQNGLQMAYKILLNSGYGAVSNPYFVNYFEPDIAEAITTSGQLINKWTEKRNNEFLNAYCGTKDYPYVIYADTDSVAGDSEIIINGSKMKIEDFFDNASSNTKVITKNGALVKHLNDQDYITPACITKTKEVKNCKVKYVMKHKVAKQLYKVTCNGKSVTITEDHSLMIQRGIEILSIKPKALKRGDRIVMVKNVDI